MRANDRKKVRANKRKKQVNGEKKTGERKTKTLCAQTMKNLVESGEVANEREKNLTVMVNDSISWQSGREKIVFIYQFIRNQNQIHAKQMNICVRNVYTSISYYP